MSKDNNWCSELHDAMCEANPGYLGWVILGGTCFQMAFDSYKSTKAGKAFLEANGYEYNCPQPNNITAHKRK
jgi:hypothetical protein